MARIDPVVRPVRLIPTRYPPVQTFEHVASTDDLEAVMALEGWTNDRLVRERLMRLPRERWVYGRANASVVMASFLHAPPGGGRFTSGDLHAWYCSFDERTAIAEVASGLRREAVNAGWAEMRAHFRAYAARLEGDYEDLRGKARARADVLDPANWTASQAYGEKRRAQGVAGLIYPSVRLKGGTNAVAFDPRNVLDVAVASTFDIIAPVAGKVVARRLS
ncbi:RES family NAD+ phosphorylase [Amphiplicatus metriothermophilus]|uniref:RES domain-containing protein n=1 Tax=Amphiplicatus metriothermophilus TaxID=1519374 RepID=A0A239PZ96_9PROT|nr:RES family NAD+ phosphorylase [Amphiplicatus metriothermophilus]MBB5518214.1 RES domain-containing protein [Amphiplicatus metriothermophilus]SNT75398.1 RES domain-containing protein [Amphiplicatus metriothermophilus]